MNIECNGCGYSFSSSEIKKGLCCSCLGDKKQVSSREINAIMLTTETAPNLNITKRIEVVTAECAFGMTIFKDLFAEVRDIVGGRSEAVQKTMRDSRRVALFD
jgi:reverse gyrase